MRQISNDLLRKYFEKQQFALDVDWNELEETQVEPLWEAWLLLSEQEQRTADADFTEVSQLANEPGIAVLIQEGEWHELDLAATFQTLDDQTDMVMWTFLNHPDVFRVSTLFYSADSIPSRSWQKWKGLPQRVPADDPTACRSLEDSLRAYFVRNEGRGRHCKVEVYQRTGRFYYFAFPEDYARAEQDFDEQGQLVRRTHRPAFQVVFVYSPETGTLDASAPGGKRVVEKLMDLALKALLGTDGRPEHKDDRVYEFERLREATLSWNYSPDSGISTVWVKALRLTFKASRDRVVLEGNKPGAAHQLYERLVSVDGKPGRVDPQSVFVTHAQIHVDYAQQGGKSVAPRDIRLTWPNLIPATWARTEETTFFARCSSRLVSTPKPSVVTPSDDGRWFARGSAVALVISGG